MGAMGTSWYSAILNPPPPPRAPTCRTAGKGSALAPPVAVPESGTLTITLGPAARRRHLLPCRRHRKQPKRHLPRLPIQPLLPHKRECEKTETETMSAYRQT